MKLRVLVLTVVISLLLCFSANAANIDIESMSVDELLELKDSIDKRLEELGENGIILYHGYSKVGDGQLESGSYIVELDTQHEYDLPFGTVFVYKNETSLNGKSLYSVSVDEDKIKQIFLEDGNVIEVANHSVVLKKQ